MNRPLNILVLTLCAAFFSIVASSHNPRAWAQDVEHPSEQVNLENIPDSLDLIPLTHISVRGQISASIAQVEVEQTYENHSQERIEAVYVFPLPSDAAVNEMIITL